MSTEEQVEGYSIDAQRRAFQALVESRGRTVYREYIEEGKSARTDNINRRPAFKEMVASALAGKFDALVVHKLDRCLFQEVWIKDKEVVAVKPQAELKPFFDLNH